MKFFNKTTASALTIAAMLSLSSTPALATDGAMDLANSICASGDVQGSLASSALDAGAKATALGEAARQAGRPEYGCKASAGDIASALSALMAANPGYARLQTAFDQQKNGGGSGQGDGIAGLETTDQNSEGNEDFVAQTLTTTPGEVPSRQ